MAVNTQSKPDPYKSGNEMVLYFLVTEFPHFNVQELEDELNDVHVWEHELEVYDSAETSDMLPVDDISPPLRTIRMETNAATMESPIVEGYVDAIEDKLSDDESVHNWTIGTK